MDKNKNDLVLPEFQSLIGTLQTSFSNRRFFDRFKFQSLIGTLQTKTKDFNKFIKFVFQSLIGTLQTMDKNKNDLTVVPESKRTKCEVWSRPVGYLRPVQHWNQGKQQEFKERKLYDKGAGGDGHASGQPEYEGLTPSASTNIGE